MIVNTKLVSSFDTAKWLPKEGEAIWDYWISFNPMAPAFGVPWRFGGDMGLAPAKPKTAAPVKRTAKAEDAVVLKSTAPAKAKPAAKPVVTKPAVVPTPVAKVAAVKPKVVAEVVKPLVAKPAPKPDPKAEVVKPAPKPAPKPVAAKKPAAPKAPAQVDELTLIKGVGPKMAEKLKAAGITSFAQIAAWDEVAVGEMDEKLGGLPGAIARADWVGQAKDLA